jgi:hypothetical protein
MRDSTPLLEAKDAAGLWQRLNADGFLLLRQAVPAEDAGVVRAKVLAQLSKLGALGPRPPALAAGDELSGRWPSWIADERDYEAHRKKFPKQLQTPGDDLPAEHEAAKGNGREAKRRRVSASQSAGISGHARSPLGSGWLVDLHTRNGVVLPPEDSDPSFAGTTRGWVEVLTDEPIRQLPNHPKLRAAYECVFRLSGLEWLALPPEEGSTWLRAKAYGESTVPHSDYGYFRSKRTILSRYYSPLQRMFNVRSLDETQLRSFCVGHCWHRGRTAVPQQPEPKRFYCSLCRVGFHADCLNRLWPMSAPCAADKRAHDPKLKAKETDDEREEGEWHCPCCSDANMDMWTCWMPLIDIPADPNCSRLMVLPRSHLLPGYVQLRNHTADGAHKEQRLPHRWKGDARSGAVWQVPSELRAGDIILFNIKLIHAANPNNSGHFRISLDTRVVATSLPLPAHPGLKLAASAGK